ncbi:UTP--glucose-1-phosphate uridylyltransferase 3, chloroplastic, partial [Tanacetum coccineum]
MATTSHFFTFSHLLHHKSTFFTFSARAPSNKLIKHPFISLPSLHATQKTTFVSTEYHLSPAPAEFDTNRLRNLCNSLTNAKTLADKFDGNAEVLLSLNSLLRTLRDVDEFYNCIGGIVGYQLMVLELLSQSVHGEKNDNFQHVNNSNSLGLDVLEIHPPSVLDLSQDTEYAAQAALWGIEGLPQLGEIYPLGGSADRLGFVDSVTGECLPAAMLPYCGRTLLEGLIRDLQDFNLHLHYDTIFTVSKQLFNISRLGTFYISKFFGEQWINSCAIMTSLGKDIPFQHIQLLCERSNGLDRVDLSFLLFDTGCLNCVCQPLVPAVSAEDGQWLTKGQFVPICKPGGHGMIWKLAYDKGVFRWFRDHRRKGATVRQVSNVVAATDLTLMAMAGIGLREEK